MYLLPMKRGEKVYFDEEISCPREEERENSPEEGRSFRERIRNTEEVVLIGTRKKRMREERKKEGEERRLFFFVYGEGERSFTFSSRRDGDGEQKKAFYSLST